MHNLRFEKCVLTMGYGTLDADNRWVKLAGLIPWDEFEDEYVAKFGETG